MSAAETIIPPAPEQEPTTLVKKLRELLAEAEAGRITSVFWAALSRCADTTCGRMHSRCWFQLDFEAEPAADERTLGVVKIGEQRMLAGIASRDFAAQLALIGEQQAAEGAPKH